jgi:hypothetical protein
MNFYKIFFFILKIFLGPRLAEEDDARRERAGHHHREVDHDKHQAGNNPIKEIARNSRKIQNPKKLVKNGESLQHW